jgi:hypothetical protein
MKDANRKGETIKTFNDVESWDLLLQLLGEPWIEAHQKNMLRKSDVAAARAWLERLDGLRT